MKTNEMVLASGCNLSSMLNLLLRLGESLIDAQVNSVIDNSWARYVANEKAHSTIFSEGLRQRTAGIRLLPGFLSDGGLYSEFRSTFESAFSAPQEVLNEFELWSKARNALPFLHSWMPYSKLVLLSAEHKQALSEFETERALLVEKSCDCIDGFTSGHHWDVAVILGHAVKNRPESSLGYGWVYMDEDFTIQMMGLMEALDTFVCEYLTEVIQQHKANMSKLNLSH